MAQRVRLSLNTQAGLEATYVLPIRRAQSWQKSYRVQAGPRRTSFESVKYHPLMVARNRATFLAASNYHHPLSSVSETFAPHGTPLDCVICCVPWHGQFDG